MRLLLVFSAVSATAGTTTTCYHGLLPGGALKSGPCREVVPFISEFFGSYPGYGGPPPSSDKNKYIEIYNPTNVELNLNDYAFPMRRGGANQPAPPLADGTPEFYNTFPAGSMLPPGGVWVVCQGDTTEAAILAVCNSTSNHLSDGSDGICLVKTLTSASTAIADGPGVGYEVLDCIGSFSAAPELTHNGVTHFGWWPCNYQFATLDRVMVRYQWVTTGNFGNFSHLLYSGYSNECEHVFEPANTYTFLGWHRYTGHEPPSPPPPSPPPPHVPPLPSPLSPTLAPPSPPPPMVSQPSPPSPPSPTSGVSSDSASTTSYVVSEFTASGDVTDYGDTERQAIAAVFATAAGVAVSAVTVVIASASVKITVSIEVPSASANVIQTTISSGVMSSPSTLQATLGAAGTSVTVASVVPPSVAATSPNADGDNGDPCFPSSALVTLADGTITRIDKLTTGDAIFAVLSNGALTTDTVTLLSIAKPDVRGATFINLTVSNGGSLTLTPAHHLPVGASCCSNVKTAAEVAVGETVWRVQAGANTAVSHTVTKVTRVSAAGLHSPVLASGSFPVVEGFVTSFDSFNKVRLAKYGLAPLLAACEATSTCEVLKRMLIART